MELDVDGSHNKTKLSQGGGISNEDISDDFKKVAPVPTKAVQINQFSWVIPRTWVTLFGKHISAKT